MDDLSSRKCEACRPESPLVTQDEIDALMPQIPDWKIIEEQNVDRLIRAFKFADFDSALAFTNRVGELAEQEGHHPAILTEWGKVTVSWWTHKINGLHINDLIMAARTDAIA